MSDNSQKKEKISAKASTSALPKSSRAPYFWILSSFFVIVAIVWSFQRQQTSSDAPVAKLDVPNHDAKALERYNICPVALNSVEWPKTQEKVDELLEKLRNPGPNMQPILIKNAPIDRWAAFQRWTPQFLSKTFGDQKLTFKVKESDPVFVYREQKPLSVKISALKKREARAAKVSSITMAEFWKRANESAKNNDHLYFSEGLSSAPEKATLEVSALLDDVQPMNIFVPKENHFINLWLGSPGVIAQTHYDQEPNFAIQVVGHKRWILSPPSEVGKILPFPYLHGHSRQSMISFESGNPIDEPDESTKLNLFDQSLPKIDAYEVIAGPGNVLYLPPFWFHRVVTEDTSIALNMWTERHGGDPLAMASRMQPILDPSWNEMQRATAIKYFLHDISDQLPKVEYPISAVFEPANRESTGVFAFDLLRTQYQILFRNASIKKKDRFSCDGNERSATSKETIAKISHEIKRAQDPASMHIVLASYTEMMLDLLMTTARVNAFIQTCL